MSEKLILPPVGECIDLGEAKLHLRVTDDVQDSLILGLLIGARQAAEMKTRNQLLHARWRLVLDRFPAFSGYGYSYPDTVNVPAHAICLPHAPLVEVESIDYTDTAGNLQSLDLADYVVNDVITPGIITPKFGRIWPIAQPEIGSVRVTYTAGYASRFTATGSTLRVTGPVEWLTDDVVQFYNSGGALPAPLQPQTNYLIATASAGAYTLKTMAGASITLTDTGTGSHYIGVVPDGIRNWIKLRLGSLYTHREEQAVLSRGSIADLPFVEGLLDPYRVDLP